MKKITAVILAMIILFLLPSCSLGAGEAKALDVIKTYVKALEEHDTETQQECLDPSSTAFSKGLVDSVGDMFGISGAYDMGIGAGGILGYASEEALGIDYSLKYKEVLKNNLGENDGDITVKYELSVKNKETGEKVSKDIMWTFKMIKKDKQWYILNYDEPEIIKSEEEMQAQLEYNSVGTVVQDIDEGYDFSDGVAWVRVGEYDELTYYCVDTSGKILFSLEKGWEPHEIYSFVNGYCVVRDTNTYNKYLYYIVNKKGEIVKELKDGEVDLEVTRVTDNGYIIVEGEYSDIYGSVTKYGILSSEGEWVKEPTGDIYSINYNGGNIFNYSYKDDSYKKEFFNAETEKTFEVTIDGYSVNNELEFNDGYALVTQLGYIYSVSENGEIKKLFAPYDDGSFDMGKYTSGMIFIADSVYNSDTCGFYDINGNLIIDLTEYGTSFDENEMYFKDGYAAFEVNGYCMFIDKNGNNVFEPKKITSYSIIHFNEGLLRIETENGVEFYDTNGNLVLTQSSNIREMPEIFSCGLGCARSNSNGICYIDKSGNIVF